MESILFSMMGVSSSPKLLLGGRWAEGFRTTKMYRTVLIFMVLEVGGREVGGGDRLQNHATCIEIS